MGKNIFGCFLKVGFDPSLDEQAAMQLAKKFHPYLWGDTGINSILKGLVFEDYGKDIELILLQFHIKPTLEEEFRIKQIEYYRKSEKSIGVSVIINDNNFFFLNEDGRMAFLKKEISNRIELLWEVVKKKKLDTDMPRLKQDFLRIWEECFT
ncbi:MAG: hypothetical protein J0L99_16825 [Chitinophagales bacterium]|nr:hypothetical protein [Chitinophagales bacterium]